MLVGAVQVVALRKELLRIVISCVHMKHCGVLRKLISSSAFQASHALPPVPPVRLFFHALFIFSLLLFTNHSIFSPSFSQLLVCAELLCFGCYSHSSYLPFVYLLTFALQSVQLLKYFSAL